MRSQDISHGRLAWKGVRPQSEGQLGKTLAIFKGALVEFTAPTPTIESAAKKSASAETTPIGGKSFAKAAIAREPDGAWTTGGRLEDDSLQKNTGQVNASYTAFFISLKQNMSVNERDIRKINAE